MPLTHRSRLSPLEERRLQHLLERVFPLGPRPIAELLIEVDARVGGMPAIIELLAEYERRLSPAMVRAANAHRFPPRPLHEVPRA